MLPIHKRFPSWATLSAIMEAFSTAPAADDMCALQGDTDGGSEARFEGKMLCARAVIRIQCDLVGNGILLV